MMKKTTEAPRRRPKPLWSNGRTRGFSPVPAQWGFDSLGRFVSSRDAAPRAQVRAAMYISRGDRLSVAALFHPLTEAVRYDARRRPLRRRRAEETHPADGRPPYFNQTIINAASTAYGGEER